nr:lysophospholipid acyltransferase family protein [Jiella sonneratiae]
MRGLCLGLEALSGRRRLESLYRDYLRDPARGDFFAEAIARMNVGLSARGTSRIPRTGPLAVVANHPFGAMDGIALGCLLGRVRGDVRIIAHSALARVPELAEKLFAIDFSGTREAERANIRARAGALAHLKGGGCLMVFPAGGVMTTPHPLSRRAVELDWGPLSARLIMRSGATVLPIHVPGQNSRLFQIASHMSQSLRYALLFHEAARTIDGKIAMTIGRPIEPQAIAGFADAVALTQWLRRQVFALEGAGVADEPDPFAGMFQDGPAESGAMPAV